jgi:hypothetical protein
MLLAVFGIENDGVNLVANLLILFLVVVWLALVYWTYSDAQRRIEDPMLVACAAAAALFPYVGTVVYMIVRPPEYLEDARERDLEIQAAEARLQHLKGGLCPHCSYEVERGFLRCPSCLRRLRDPCPSCSKPLDPRWKICPYCEAEIVPPPQARTAGKRSADRVAAPSAAEARARRRRAAANPPR